MGRGFNPFFKVKFEVNMIAEKWQYLLLILAVFITAQSQAQDKFTGYFEPAFEVSHQVDSSYKYSFAIENRNVVYDNDQLDYTVKQIDLSHLSEYQWHPEWVVGLGFQYRIESAFDTQEENELRIQEQLVYTPEGSNFQTKHRVRVEQRLYASVSKHRLRYQLGYTFPLHEANAKKPYLKVDTESLLEIAKTQKPEFEQRLGVGVGWSVGSKTTLQFGVEYQLEDFTQQFNHEVFLLAEVGIAL